MTMTTMVAAATATPTELASDYIQQCLGFTSISSMIRSLDSIQSSLQNCGVGGLGVTASSSAASSAAGSGSDADAAGVREEWRAFLQDGH